MNVHLYVTRLHWLWHLMFWPAQPFVLTVGQARIYCPSSDGRLWWRPWRWLRAWQRICSVTADPWRWL